MNRGDEIATVSNQIIKLSCVGQATKVKSNPQGGTDNSEMGFRMRPLSCRCGRRIRDELERGAGQDRRYFGLGAV